MKKGKALLVVMISAMITIILAVGMGTTQTGVAQTPADYFVAREIELSEAGFTSLNGMAYSPQSGNLLLIQGQDLLLMDGYERPGMQVNLGQTNNNKANVGYNARTGSLDLYDSGTGELVQFSESEGFQASSAKRTDVGGADLSDVEGITFDPQSGTAYFLNPSGKQIVAIQPDSAGNYEWSSAAAEGRISRFQVKVPGQSKLSSLSFNPTNGSLFTLDSDQGKVYEISTSGETLSTLELSTTEVMNPSSIMVAPSGDQTDDASKNSLYVAGADALGQPVVYEVAMGVSADIGIAAVNASAILVNTIDTSKWNPPSPDPSGLEYNFTLGKLQISDSEVDEMSIYAGANVYIASTSGNLNTTCTTLSFSKEPTGTAANPNNGHLFFSDDNKDRIFEVNLGNDGKYCTADDSVTFIDSTSHGSGDGEGVAYGAGKIFISDGLNQEIYVIDPGTNGQFGDSNDTSTHFDVGAFGLRDPEGIGYNSERNSLFIVSRKDSILVETSISGNLLNTFDISSANINGPAGVGAGPGSADPSSFSIYVSARGVDNNADPNENDGKIYEFSLSGGGGGGNPTPTPTPTPTPPPPSGNGVYLSFADGGKYTIGGLSGIRDEDIISLDGGSAQMVFDGSDVGVGGVDVNAFYFVNANTILMSFDNSVSLSGVGTVTDKDIIQFNATSLGNNTSGSFSLYFQGGDVGMDAAAEDIDGLFVLPDGRIILSTKGNAKLPGVSGRDRDLYAFTPTSLGANTAGSWELYFQGADVGLSVSDEDIDGLTIDGNGNIYLSTLGIFSVQGVSGDDEDIFVCSPSSLGSNTACSFSMFFDGSANGVGAFDVDGIGLP